MELQQKIDGQKLSVEELLGFCSLLLVAGNETTTNLIGNAVLCLAESPGTIERLLREPALLPQTIEEVLRFRSPVQSMYRVTASETTLGDERIPAGAPIVAWIGSARIALEALLSRLPGLSLVHGAHLERMESTIVYGLKALPVRWQPD